MFVPDRLKTNAYRVLRLSANATLSEIHKAAAGMRRAATLGLVGTTEADIPVLGEVPRTEADIRTALGRLANPALRLTDRLFWFHLAPQPENVGAPTLASEAIPGLAEGAACGHDEALHGLFAALEAGLDDSGVALWVRVLQAWHQAVSDDAYWALALAIEERGGFEPAALPSELDALRDDTVRLASEALVVAGRDALARNDTSTVRRILLALEVLANTGPWAVAAQEDIASPAVDRFRTLCDAVREEFGSKIVRQQDAAESNKSLCDAALKRFRGEIELALDGVIQLLPPDHEAAQQSREAAAFCLSAIATDYTWADDFIASEELHEEALNLAQDTLGAIRIEDGLEQVREPARKQRVFGALKPISSAPTLQTTNGIGFTIYGKSNCDNDTDSYETTRYFVVLGIPILPVGRYRVIHKGGGTYAFLGKLPLRKGDRWHLGIVTAALVVMIISSMISSSSTSSNYSSNSYVPNSPSPSPENSTGILGGTTKPHSTNQRNYDYSRTTQLSNLKARIDAGRSRISILKVQLQPVFDERDALDKRMKAIASVLTVLDGQHSAGIQIDIGDYNEKVDTYNGLLSRYRAIIAANSDFQLYQEMIKQDELLVAQYNALPR